MDKSAVNTNRLPFLILLVSTSTIAPLESRAQTGETWEFSLTPYIWAAAISGTTSAEGSEPPPINPGYNFFSFDNLNGFAFVDFVASKGRWSINADAVYVAFTDNLDGESVNAQIDLDGSIFEIGGGYALSEEPGWELLFGTRGINLESAIELTPGPDGASDQTAWAYYVGTRFQHDFQNNWGLHLRADVGAFSGFSSSTVNALAIGSYRFNERFALKFGYRYLQFDFAEEDLVADLEILGYVLGLQFNW